MAEPLRASGLGWLSLVIGLAASACVAASNPAPNLEPSPTATVAGSTADISRLEPPPTTGAPSTTATLLSSVMVRLSQAEMAALGPGLSVHVADSAGSWEIELTRDSPEAAVLINDDVAVTATYRYDGVPSGVSWMQTIGVDRNQVQQTWRDETRRCRPSIESDEPVVVIWQALGDRSTYRSQLAAAPDVVTVVSPIWWFVQADGSITESGDADYVRDVHDTNRAIWPAIAGLDADANHEAFGDPEHRVDLAHQLSDRARDLGADGINLDIEGYRVEDAPAFLSFVETLVPLVHDWGGIVSYDVIPRTDEWDVTPDDLSFWSVAPPRRELAAAVDCMVLMAYDQHNRFRPSGPVASPDWVLSNLHYLLRFADPEDVVLGLPFYGRIWDPDELDRPRAVGVDGLPAGESIEFDPAFGLDKVTLSDGRFYWDESPSVLADRLRLVDDFGLAGWAAWRFGFDSPGLWDALADN